MPLLEMAIVMMKPTLLPVIMMLETAVCLMLLQIIAQNALVISKRLVLLDFFLHQLEMAIAMMKPTTKNVIMMEETVVGHASIQITAQTALALAMLLAMEFLILLWEMGSAMMR